MKEYKRLVGGVQMQTYDLWWQSETAREGIKMLASIYGNKTVILSGVTNSPGFIGAFPPGCIIYNGLPINVKNSRGTSLMNVPEMGIGQEPTLCVEIQNRSTGKKVYNKEKVLCQEPFWITEGEIVWVKQAEQQSHPDRYLVVSSMVKVDNALADILASHFSLKVDETVYNDSIKSLQQAIDKKQDKVLFGGGDLYSVNPNIQLFEADSMFWRYGKVVQIGGGFEWSENASTPLYVGAEVLFDIDPIFCPKKTIYINVLKSPLGQGENQITSPYYIFELSPSGVLTCVYTHVTPTGAMYINPTTYIAK